MAEQAAAEELVGRSVPFWKKAAAWLGIGTVGTATTAPFYGEGLQTQDEPGAQEYYTQERLAQLRAKALERKEREVFEDPKAPGTVPVLLPSVSGASSARQAPGVGTGAAYAPGKQGEAQVAPGVTSGTPALASGASGGAERMEEADQKKKTASSLPVIDPGTKEWQEAVENLREGRRGEVRVPSSTDAKKLLNEARGNMNRYKRYTTKQYKNGYEVHPNESGTRNAPHNDLPHVKWKDWQSDDAYGSGHIFFEKPN